MNGIIEMLMNGTLIFRCDEDPLHINSVDLIEKVLNNSSVLFHAQGASLREPRSGSPQHDEVEPNLKKIPHRNGIWVLKANSI